MDEKINTLNNSRSKTEYFWIFVDVLMVIVVIVNLLFLTFDWSFGNTFFRDFIQGISNDFFVYYRDVVHPNFLLYDFYFVAFFLFELGIQWIISIVNKSYSKWWLYPFINWYDVMGCIPIGAFRWLRLFRVFAIIIRLDKMKVVHVRKTFVYKQFYSTYQMFVQEAADRALIQMIDAVQRGLKSDSNGVENKSSVLAEAIKPDQSALAKVLSAKIHTVIENNYTEHRDDMKEQISLVIKNGFENSEEMKKLENLPFVGKRISIKLEDLLNDITFQLADSLSSKLASDEVAQILENIINTTLDAMMKENKELTTKTGTEKELSEILMHIVDRALQTVKVDIDTNRKSKARISEPEEDDPKLKKKKV